MPQTNVCGNQRQTLWSQLFFPTFTWVPEVEVRFKFAHGKRLHLLSHLTDPRL